MCGINGIFGYADDAPAADRAELLRTREQMHRRGPDGAGLWMSADRRIGLAHRRLAVIDLSDAAAQPMATADGRYQIVFNGEIYNYRQLRTDLSREGVTFRTNSDTEVMLLLYAREGSGMCRRLRGMYAFAVWDAVQQTLFLGRDPFGIKPLYVHDDGRTLRFASQVKALLAGGAVRNEISAEGVQGYWIWGHVPEPHTLYRGVVAVEPGTWRLQRRGGEVRSGAFESVGAVLGLEPGLGGGDTDGAGSTLREAFLDSVRHHLVADVPVGVFLSSGIDSSTIVALAAECGSELRTLTLGFREYQGTADDETVLAEQVARQYGTRHETVWISRADFEGAFDSFMDAMDQPSIDGLNTWLVSRAAAQRGLKVALSGLGGDELFGGYPSFSQLPRIRRLARGIPGQPGLGRILRKMCAPLLRRFTSEKFAGLLEYGATWEGAYLLRRAVRMPWEVVEDPPPAPRGESPRREAPDHVVVAHLESTMYMRNQLLRDADWAGMAHSVELRVPFVDVELARHVARQSRRAPPLGKQDVAGCARPPLPRAIALRRKTGFSVPVRDWIMDRGAEAPERGLRGWQVRVFRATDAAQGAGLRLPMRAMHALWAPEMAVPGGVQNYMWRLWEMLVDSNGGVPIPPKGLSLMDTSAALAAWANPTRLRPVGAGGSRLRFVALALRRPGRAPHVIVGHVNQAPVAWLASVLGLIEDYVVVLHGIEAWRRLSWTQRRALRRARSVIATTNYTVRACTAANDLPAGNFEVIPLCAEPLPVQPDPGFRLDGEWPILFVARLARSERYKGLDTVIEAVAQLKRQGLRIVKLHVIGDGDDRPRLEAFARQNQLGAEDVNFHGRVDHAVLQAAYASARAFVMPSANEGFGIVFLEAMRSGVPCIGGAHGGTPEVFNSGVEGLLVEYGNISELAGRLRSLVASRETSELLGRAGQRRFLNDYTFQRFAGRWRHAIELVPRAPGSAAVRGFACVEAEPSNAFTVSSRP